MALAHFFEDIGIDWFEDPIPARDEIGYAKLAGLMETPLAVGSTLDSREAFFRVIRAGARPHDPPRRRAGSAASRRS